MLFDLLSLLRQLPWVVQNQSSILMPDMIVVCLREVPTAEGI